VIDVIGEALRSVAMRSPASYPLVLGAGILTSVGPCTAPRYIAVAALAQAARRPAAVIACFVAGLVGAYVIIGFAAGAVAAVATASTPIYAALAIALGVGAVVTLLRAERPHVACHDRAALLEAGDGAGFGGVFLLGAASALVVSPCCTPVVAGIAGLTVNGGRSTDGGALLATFACGHALPVAAAGMLGTRTSALLQRVTASQAPAVVAGGLMLALAAYYGTLA
jgi:thiol:disulfide interchange protein DsbD